VVNIGANNEMTRDESADYW